MNLDYRKGEINFSDLNSEREYDPDTAFYQSQLANMLTVTRLAKHWKDENISVNAVRREIIFISKSQVQY